MLVIVGELRKVEHEEYTNKRTGQVDRQAILVIEPRHGRDNFQVYLSSKQRENGLADWQQLRGKQVQVPVNLYVSFEHKFFKYNLLGAGKPLPETVVTLAKE